ncbi:MAG: DUF3127 domain-containing protein [Saprospiraceae bacterium]|nr:DUF3127 domain-containing protein [Saprospiraceae bacterium]
MADTFQIKGRLHKKFDIESKTATFQAREFVLLTDEQYPQYLKFQLTQDRCSVIDPFQEGQEVEVFFDLRGREWNGKYFTNLNAWRVTGVMKEAENSFDVSDPEPPIEWSDDGLKAEDFGDLPF